MSVWLTGEVRPPREYESVVEAVEACECMGVGVLL